MTYQFNEPEERARVERISNPVKDVVAAHEVYQKATSSIDAECLELDFRQSLPDEVDIMYRMAIDVLQDIKAPEHGSGVWQALVEKRSVNNKTGLFISALLNTTMMEDIYIDGPSTAMPGYRLTPGKILAIGKMQDLQFHCRTVGAQAQGGIIACFAEDLYRADKSIGGAQLYWNQKHGVSHHAGGLVVEYGSASEPKDVLFTSRDACVGDIRRFECHFRLPLTCLSKSRDEVKMSRIRTGVTRIAEVRLHQKTTHPADRALITLGHEIGIVTGQLRRIGGDCNRFFRKGKHDELIQYLKEQDFPAIESGLRSLDQRISEAL